MYLLVLGLVIMILKKIIVSVAIFCSFATAQVSAGLISATNNTPGIADSSSGERTVTFNTDFTVTDVNITIEFAKCNSTADLTGCTSDSGGTPFFDEIFFGLKDPTGMIDIELIPFFTWTSGSSPNFQGSFTLDDAAASLVNSDPSRPQEGTFQPINALSAFNGISSLGDWTLTFSDNSGGDPLVFLSYTLELNGDQSIPEPASYSLLLLGLVGLIGSAYWRKKKALAV